MPKPSRCGGSTGGPPDSCQTRHTVEAAWLSRLISQCTQTRPTGDDSAPYFAAFVANSWIAIVTDYHTAEAHRLRAVYVADDLPALPVASCGINRLTLCPIHSSILRKKKLGHFARERHRPQNDDRSDEECTCEIPHPPRHPYSAKVGGLDIPCKPQCSNTDSGANQGRWSYTDHGELGNVDRMIECLTSTTPPLDQVAADQCFQHIT